MQAIAVSADVLNEMTEQAAQMNNKVSFKEYLLKNNYVALSNRLFVKDEPAELIRLSRRNGQTVYRNFAQKDDKGTLMDFLRNRSVEDGKVVPNKKLSTFMRAMEKANNFLQQHKVERMPRKAPRNILFETNLNKGIGH